MTTIWWSFCDVLNGMDILYYSFSTFPLSKFFRLESMMGKRKSSFDIPVNCPFVYTIFDLTSLNKVSVRVVITYGLSIFCTYLWLYRIFCAEATEIKCFQINRYDNKSSSFEALENVWKNKLLTSLWFSKLWFSKMPATGFTHTNVYLIKLF